MVKEKHLSALQSYQPVNRYLVTAKRKDIWSNLFFKALVLSITPCE